MIQSSLLISNISLLLSAKERQILGRRFSLDGQPRATLEAIGQDFAVTRERVRQIEALALSKLHRTMQNNGLKPILQTIEEVLRAHGGLLREDVLFAQLLNNLFENPETAGVLDHSVLSLSLAVMKQLTHHTKNIKHAGYYRLDTVSREEVQAVGDVLVQVLDAQNEVMSAEKLVVAAQKALAKKHALKQSAFIRSVADIDLRLLVNPQGEYGLSAWRHVRPKNLRDKAYIVLLESGQPMHFTAIANAIMERRFDKKAVTVQAVHNDLIRSPLFVLMGRGMYALAQWGYSQGTVADVIKSILLQHNRPMTKREIVEGVLALRSVQEATISLNLQKSPHFVRVGTALYALDETKEPPKKQRRGRSGGRPKKSIE